MLVIHNIKTQQSLQKPHTLQTSADLHKVIKTLQKILTQQRQRRQKAEQNLQQFRQRAIKRQQQFSSIISKLKQYNSTVIKQNPQISKLFRTIWTNFDMFNTKSKEIIQQKYQDIVDYMSKKVNSILLIMKQEIDKNRLKTTMNLENIQQDIRDVYAVALKIQDRNVALAQEIKELQFQLKVLKEQKVLILEDSINRKNKLSVLKSENKKLNQDLLKQRLEKCKVEKPVEKQMQGGEDPKLFYNRRRSQSKLSQEKTGENKKDLPKHRSQLYSFQTIKTNHDNRMETLQYMKDNKDSIIAKDKSAFLNTTISFTPKSNNNSKISARVKNKSSFSKNRASFHGRGQSFQFDQFNTIPVLQGVSVMAPNSCRQPQPQPETVNAVPVTSLEHYQRTIAHLQKCLQRQKIRNKNMTQTINELLSKSKQINDTLQKIFREEEMSNKLQTIVKSQKLIKILRVLKQRLGALQAINVNCGWGDVIDEF